MLTKIHAFIDRAAAKWRAFKLYMSAIPEPVYDPTVRVKPSRAPQIIVAAIAVFWIGAVVLQSLGVIR